jgi:hypothetical protein
MGPYPVMCSVARPAVSCTKAGQSARGSVMADDSKQSFPNIGGNGFIWILVAAATTYFVAHQIPLEGSRPATAGRSISEHVGEQHVDARLWQDPFAAVAEALTKSPELKPENCDRNYSGYKDIEMYCRPPSEAPGAAPDLTLLVSVSGTPYSEDQEARRRKRYAVLAGLDAEGFVPEDPQHIGFYWPSVSSASSPASIAQSVAPPGGALAVRLAAAPPPSTAVPLPKTVPFEWFKLRPERINNATTYQRILLLWFDEDVLAANASPAIAQSATAPPASRPRQAPLRQFAKLLCRYLPQRTEQSRPDKAKVRILGPQLSTTLKAVVDEVNNWPQDADWSGGNCPGLIPPSFYVSDATVGDATLIPDYVREAARASEGDGKRPSCLASDTCLRDFFHSKGIELYRFIATDEALARTIRAELALRHVDQQNPPSEMWAVAKLNGVSATLEATLRRGLDLPPIDQSHHIALISEWDTLYGRALPDTMARCLGQPTCEPPNGDPFRGKDWLHPFKYLRGLDGQMPNADGSGSGASPRDSGNKQDKDSKDTAKSRPDPRAKDRAEGQSQFDYLNRLGDQIQQLDAELRRKNRRGIEAVGVLGSDVYDKLLVLQALRPLLPNAWFFTTDLDALLLHPGAQTLTRNLLVASSFGLQLRSDIQGEIPPFRSGYQTAQFLATRVATRSESPPTRNSLWQPLMFEIGTSRAFQFALASARPDESKVQEPPATDASGSSKSEAEECGEDLLRCDEINPPPSEMVPPVSLLAKIGLMGFALALALGIVLSFRSLRDGAWNGLNSFMGGATRYRGLIARTVAIAIVVGAVSFLLGKALYLRVPQIGDWLTQDGQPLTLLEGISVWPTIFLRVAALALCVWLIGYSRRYLDRNLDEIVKDFHLNKTWKRVRAEQAEIVSSHGPWVGLVARFWYPSAADASSSARGAASSLQSVSSGWGTYIYQGSLSSRMWRVTAAIVAMLLFWATLLLIFGQPHAPIRGHLSLYAYEWVTFFIVFATLFLVFFVADTTLLSWGLVRAFHKGSIVWPPEALQKYGNRLGFKHQPGDRPAGEHRCLDDWLALIFLSKRTKCITALLYWPFLIIALIVVSRSRLFANFNPSIPDLVTMGAGVLIVTASAILLRRSAEAARETARRKLRDQIAEARSLPDGGPFASQLELLLRRVEDLREGAFSPYSQQPVVRAMLLPLGSLGGTALLEYLLVPGFG